MDLRNGLRAALASGGSRRNEYKVEMRSASYRQVTPGIYQNALSKASKSRVLDFLRLVFGLSTHETVDAFRVGLFYYFNLPMLVLEIPFCKNSLH